MLLISYPLYIARTEVNFLKYSRTGKYYRVEKAVTAWRCRIIVTIRRRLIFRQVNPPKKASEKPQAKCFIKTGIFRITRKYIEIKSA
jgi:hypothetical protein